MPVGDMRRFMGDDRLQGLGAFEPRYHPRMNEDRPRIDHEGIGRAVINQQHLDLRRAQTGRPQNRRCQLAQGMLDIGVPNDRRRLRGHTHPYSQHQRHRQRPQSCQKIAH